MLDPDDDPVAVHGLVGAAGDVDAGCAFFAGRLGVENANPRGLVETR
jgi:hypothetical protein